MSQLEKVKVFLKCKRMIKTCINSNQHLIALKYVDLAKKKEIITNKQYKYLRTIW